MRCFIAWLAVAAATATAQSQSPAGPGTDKVPEFEVATIRLADPNGMHTIGVQIYPGGRVVIPTSSLKGLIITAFHLSYSQIAGGEDWIDKDLYAVEAKPPENLQPSITNLRHTWFDIEDVRLREMLQALLIDRFQLRFHRETKTGQIYLLEKSGKTFRLRPTEIPSTPQSPSGETRLSEVEFVGGRWFLFNAAMPQLAKFGADYYVHAPVLDRTGLSGSFDYKQPPPLTELEVNSTADSESFKDLIREIGLKLEPAQGPVETFIIDHAEKPSPN
jgi:uncharacterized protein (TIGR03435 family)